MTDDTEMIVMELLSLAMQADSEAMRIAQAAAAEVNNRLATIVHAGDPSGLNDAFRDFDASMPLMNAQLARAAAFRAAAEVARTSPSDTPTTLN